MSLFNNQYRVETTRLKEWDYGACALYFVTVCTKNMVHFFGSISNDEMNLSPIGKIVEHEWLRGPVLRPDMKLILDEYVVMPNHFHAIISIGENKFNTGTSGGNQFGIQSNNLASIIRGFKSAVTKETKAINPHFSWQTRYHDHVIRNQNSYSLIRNYIMNNVVNWKADKFYR